MVVFGEFDVPVGMRLLPLYLMRTVERLSMATGPRLLHIDPTEVIKNDSGLHGDVEECCVFVCQGPQVERVQKAPAIAAQLFWAKLRVSA
jgi:hypothetical protein